MKDPLFKLGWAPAIVIAFHVLATLAGWYSDFWWFDMLLHFLGGAAIAISSYYFLGYFSIRQKFQTHFDPLYFLILISFTALAAVCWEFMEFSFDNLAHTILHQPSMKDTIRDLTMGMLGGSAAGILALIWSSKK